MNFTDKKFVSDTIVGILVLFSFSIIAIISKSLAFLVVTGCMFGFVFAGMFFLYLIGACIERNERKQHSQQPIMSLSSFKKWWWMFIPGHKKRFLKALPDSEGLQLSKSDEYDLEKSILQRLRKKVAEYDSVQIDLKYGWDYLFYHSDMQKGEYKNGLNHLMKTLKKVGGYRNGQYHFCHLRFLEYQCNSHSINLDTYFSRYFNEACARMYCKLLTHGLEKVKQDIVLLSDYYMEELNVFISKEYVALKLYEAEVRYRIEVQRAEAKEEAKAQKELERAIRNAETDKNALLEKLKLLNKELTETTDSKKLAKLENTIGNVTEKLKKIQVKYERALSMAQFTREGDVYIISNEKSFGKGVFKIGMTRRDDPIDRVTELSNASVPFPFEVHTFIHTMDAPNLERALHQRFSDRRVNELNMRKEFFRVTIPEIKDALQKMGIEAEWSFTDTDVLK